MRGEQIKSPPAYGRGLRHASRARQWVIPTVSAALVVTDCFIAALSFAAAFYLRQGGPIIQSEALGWSAKFAPYGALMGFVIVIRVLTLRYYDLYRLRGEFSFFDDGL